MMAKNLSNPDYVAIRVLAVKQGLGANGEDIVSETEGNVFVAKTPETFTYDFDGNLMQDGRWNYTWDGENRLIGQESLPSVPAEAKQKLTFVYDYRNRRVEKKVYQWDEQTSAYEAAPSKVTRFLYDGWNIVAELDASNAVTRSYLWGLDLSGSQQGAGGVGGLLAMTDHTVTPAKTYTYAYDGNGNVTDLVDENGVVVAHYEYSPFGETIVSTGAMAKENPFRFSTKYTNDETGLVSYEFRDYDPSRGWISRDPVNEEGHMMAKSILSDENDDVEIGVLDNPYCFAHNNAINYIDVNGEWIGPVIQGVRALAPVAARELGKQQLKKKLKKIAECEAIHAAYKAADAKAAGCKPCLSASEYTPLLLARAAEIAGRKAYLSKKCDYVLPGSNASQEAGHKTQLNEKIAAFTKCAGYATAAGLTNIPSLP